MQNGHRRTQSDDYYSNIKNSLKKPQLKLRFKLAQNDICGLIKKTNNIHKNKTVYVDTLDEPQQRSDQDAAFNFGKKAHITGSLLYSQRNDRVLQSIPEKKPLSQLSMRKSNAKSKSKSCRKGQSQKVTKKRTPSQQNMYLYSPYFIKSVVKQPAKKVIQSQLSLNFKARNCKMKQQQKGKYKKVKPLTLRPFK